AGRRRGAQPAVGGGGRARPLARAAPRRGSGQRAGQAHVLPHPFRVPVADHLPPPAMTPPVEPPVPLAAQYPATAHVFADRLDDRITVAGDDGHPLQRARRVRAGEHVTVADGYGRWRAYDVVRAEGGAVELDAITLVAREPSLTPRLTVACSLTKGQKPELA